MKKLLKTFLLPGLVTVSIFAFSSCADDSPAPPQPQATSKLDVPQNPYLITPDQAIENLKEFGSPLYETESRSDEFPKIAEIIPFPISIPMSRSEVRDSILNDALLYFVNFDKNAGFAVVSGDIRIPQSLLCITSKGRFELVNGMVDVNGNPVVKTPQAYPKTGPTFFTTTKYPGEVFINPNIGDFYVSDKGETIIGNYEFEKSGMNNDLNLSEIDSVFVFNPSIFIAQLCKTYVTEKFNRRLAINDGLCLEFDYENGVWVDGGRLGGGGGDSSTEYTVINEYTPWKRITGKDVPLSDFSSWNQGSPYNELYPVRHSYAWGKTDRAPVGCLPLSVAKVMAYLKVPSSLRLNGYDIDWNMVELSYNRTTNKPHKTNLLYGIAEACGSWYFFNGTYTFPSQVASFMKSNGFTNARFENYSISKAISMIQRGYPTIVYGTFYDTFHNTHVWNIDGYKVQMRTKTTTIFKNNVKQSSKETQEINQWVHCDFGWNGNFNGYFCTDIFDFKSEDTEFDNFGNNIPADRNNMLHILLYDGITR